MLTRSTRYDGIIPECQFDQAERSSARSAVHVDITDFAATSRINPRIHSASEHRFGSLMVGGSNIRFSSPSDEGEEMGRERGATCIRGRVFQ